jgi:hypothetical protein
VFENAHKVSNNCQVPNSKAQQLFRLTQQLEKCQAALAAAKLEQGNNGHLFPSFQDLDRLVADYEKAKQDAVARALTGVSLDPRECRRAWGLIAPLPAPG